MKYFILLLMALLMTGCMSRVEKDNTMKSALCQNYGLEAQVFRFDEQSDPDVICFDTQTGEHVYFEFVR